MMDITLTTLLVLFGACHQVIASDEFCIKYNKFSRDTDVYCRYGCCQPDFYYGDPCCDYRYESSSWDTRVAVRVLIGTAIAVALFVILVFIRCYLRRQRMLRAGTPSRTVIHTIYRNGNRRQVTANWPVRNNNNNNNNNNNTPRNLTANSPGLAYPPSTYNNSNGSQPPAYQVACPTAYPAEPPPSYNEVAKEKY